MSAYFRDCWSNVGYSSPNFGDGNTRDRNVGDGIVLGMFHYYGCMHHWNRWTDRVHVVVADAVADRLDETATAIADRDAWTTTTATSVAEAIAELDDDRDPHDERAVDCVVGAETVSDGTGLDLLRAVRDRDPDLPVVLYPETASGRVASEATAADVTEYLPRELDENYSTLRERIDAAVERYRQQRDQRELVTMFRSLMENISETIYFKDAEGRHVCVSSWAQSRAPTDLLGKTDLEAYGNCGEDLMQRTYEEDLRVASTGQSIVDQEEPVVIDDEIVWFRTAKHPWRTATGDGIGLFGITRDVTEQKEREQRLERQNRQLDEFASFVSNDLRSPLGVATGYLELARETGDESALEKVEDALDRIETLSDEMISMSRTDQRALSTTWIELRDLVEQTWAGAETDGCSLQCEVTAGTTVKANGGRLCRLLENLFRNAVDHAGRDATVTVDVTETGFYVETDGSEDEIDTENRDTAFESATTDAGTGLDLATTTDVAEAHDWELAVTDGTTGGVRFEIDACPVLTNEVKTATVDGTHTPSNYADVGNAAPAGDYVHDESDGTWTVRGGGRDLWRAVDEHAFVYTPVSGDVRIVCRLTDLEWVHKYSKAGIMIRGGDSAGSPLFFAGMTPYREAETASRTDERTTIACQQFPDRGGIPHWFRIDRVGEQVTSYTSTDGDEWDVLDQAAFRSTDAVAAGLAVCSHNPDVRCTAAFSDVRVVTLQSEV